MATPWASTCTIGAAAAMALVAGATPATRAADAQAARAGAPWRDLTPRAGLAGWKATGGDATYTVENGELIGRAMPGKTNSWLVSDARFGDYIMEF